MRKILLTIVLGLSVLCAQAQHQSLEERGVKVSNVAVANNDGKLFVSMDVDPSALKVRTNQRVVITPILMGEGISKKLPGINLSGRNNYIRQLRNEKDPKELENVYRQKRKNSPVIEYQVIVPYETWMGSSNLVLEDSRCGCLDKVFGEKQEESIAEVNFEPKDFIPEYLFITPEAVEKDRKACGRAFVDFPVNDIVIYPDYRKNESELQKIYATIDSVRNTPDAQITAFTIVGHASPEGPYDNNVRLAKNRTQALLKHIQDLFSLPTDILSMDSVPEDWDGLRRFVEKSGLAQKEEILEIIDSDMEPDPKNWKLKATFPQVYHYLLTNCYPALRHSDYTVAYTVKSYTDVEEAKRVLKERPGNLSLHEFNMIANTYEEGTPEFEEVFDIMVRIYPNDEIANLNAANVSMRRGDLESAEKFLAKAGDTPKATYGRAVYQALIKDFDTAIKLFKQAEEAGIAEASAALEQIENILK